MSCVFLYIRFVPVILAIYRILHYRTTSISDLYFPLQQLSVTEVKVDKVQVSGTDNTTFAVCLDQDEKKVLQCVSRYGGKTNT